jgi:3-hydroxyacyl-CoA dehydrogenase
MTGAASSPRVAVIGSGVIGRSWTAVFARAGCRTTVFDSDENQLTRALGWLEEWKSPEWGAVQSSVRLDEALHGVEYVQECAPEQLELKQQLFGELDRKAPRSAILASSTSAFDMSDIARRAHHPERCVVAHPTNPPHVIPLVEVLGGILTSPEAIARSCELLARVGQTPVPLKKHVHGFVLNRLQFALVREALHLLKAGVADVEAIDKVVSEGLGLRWALLGPFGVADTNNDEGVRAYFGGHEAWITDLMDQLGPTPTLETEVTERIGDALDRTRGPVSRADVRAWRDRLVLAIRRLKARNPLGRAQTEEQLS